ncbi:ABC transporter ATP-binding protein [Loigolactobacillus bifermentans]|uniref:ABC-type nitrate sulfonate bicarbonate transport system, ATPase component n=1 Tax=Loigolactobacillus bifermentans DSM 20003 TaxID=1423726 RepID=A0A0R1GGL1_9LACO|nr:ABC transporter ATP-binding protein [Loigolactobacillus bifermentans]KRK33350.1 ABC-type nitrate sulfonate bicarbonate transport system, ATPase component [Loigolactobacillus bifermentans DSM 20003]QGG60805.1 ATP-binding cassette domain-containing protein [Loigolactobacillus bifermentans]
MTTDFLTLQNIRKQYGATTALHDVNFNLKQGEFLALVGMSGGGKSTTLRLIADLEQPTSGTIDYAEAQPVVRVMFQNDRLLPWLKVLENVSFKSRDPQVQVQAATMLDLVGLTDFASVYPSQLSGGQKQRVALARALMAKPQLLLLDEPLGALDALTRRKMQDLILDICHKQHLTTILVTHDVDEAARMADRIIVMKDGTNLYEEPGLGGKTPEKLGIVAEQVLQDIMGPQPDVKGVG